MKYWFSALLLCASGCTRSISYETYQEKSGEITVEAPRGWPKEYEDSFERKPIASVSWIGELVDGREGKVVGAVIEVRKLWRRPQDHPEPRNFGRYEKNVLQPTADLFTGKQPADLLVADTTLAGNPGRSYRRSMSQTTGGGLHGEAISHPSRVEGVALQTPEAYYILEYRATTALFDKYYPAFNHLKTSFQLRQSGR